MGGRRRRAPVVVLATVAMTFVAGSGVATAAAAPTPDQLDAGLLTVDDLDTRTGFEEVDRRELDAAALAAPDRGPCNGPNAPARAVEADPTVVLVTAAFGTDAGASLTQDVYSFANERQAKRFMARNAKQVRSCDEWDGQLQGAMRTYVVDSVTAEKLGDGAFVASAAVEPTTTGATGFDGELIRETTYARVGSVVMTLQFLRSVDYPSDTPGPGYPKRAVRTLAQAL